MGAKRMKRKNVTSSNVASVGYEEETSTLEVEFKSGAIYQYSDVPKSEFEGLINASSVGMYLNSHVKTKYNYTKVN